MKSVALATLALTLTFCGCAGYFTPKVHKAGTDTFHSPVWTTEGLYLVDIGGPGVLFIRHPATDLSHYTGLLIDDIQIHSKEKNTQLRPKEEESLRNYTRRALLRVFDKSELALVDSPGTDVLRVRISISDVDFERIYLDGANSKTVSPSGGFTAVLEFRDSLNRDRLMLFTEKRVLPMGTYFGPGAIELERIEDAVDNFARDVRVHVIAARNGSLPAPAGPLELESVSAPPPTPPKPQARVVLRGVNFDFDSALPIEGSQAVIDIAAETLLVNPEVRVRVEGHTDAVGPTEYNRDLSRRRAEAVQNMLIAAGVSAERLEVVAHGEDQPIADNGTADSRRINRRVQLERAD